MEDDEAARMAHWAAGQIRRLWPALVDEDFEKYLAGFIPEDELEEAERE